MGGGSINSRRYGENKKKGMGNKKRKKTVLNMISKPL